MAQYQGVNINISGEASSVEVTDALVALNRSMEYQFANLGSDNIGEIGGWIVGTTQLTSKNLDVGMSTDSSQTENIRFWAGSSSPTSAPFQVYDTGRVVANNITMTGGDISWGDVNAPLYTEVLGPKPPANADNTDSVIVVNGSNFTKVAGAYVYTGPANYSQINGGPPTNADNTAASLPSSLGINYTKIGSTYIYTGTVNANQINAGTINANYINGGTLTGISINVSTDLRVGNNIYVGNVGDYGSTKRINFSNDAFIEASGGWDLYLASMNLYLSGSTINFDPGATVTGLNVIAKFG